MTFGGMDGSSSESKQHPSHYKNCVMCAINGNLTIFETKIHPDAFAFHFRRRLNN